MFRVTASLQYTMGKFGVVRARGIKLDISPRSHVKVQVVHKQAAQLYKA